MKQYWIVKTSADDDGEIVKEYWEEFKDPNKNEGKTVIAIGWMNNHSFDPDKISKKEILAYISGKYYPATPRRALVATNIIWKFLHEMRVGDEVILCKGFPGNQKKPVRVYGIAEITGTNWNHIESSWGFHLKRQVNYISIIEKDFDINKFTELIGKKSLRLTIHEINESNFNQTKEWLTTI